MTSIHIVSHGSPGCLYLGNSQLSLDTLNSYQTQLESWSGCELLIYGCNVAAGDAGDEFVSKLYEFTGKAIAASTTPIGNPIEGGNWELEYRLGRIDTDLAFNQEIYSSYAGIFGEEEDPLAPELVEELSEDLSEDLSTVTTDKQDYSPASTATITGENFQPGETVELQVLHNDGTPNTGGGHEPWQVTDGSTGDLDGAVNGTIITTWFVNPDDSLNSSFDLTAIGLTSGKLATHYFTDSDPAIQFFYVPGEEDDILSALSSLTPNALADIGTGGIPTSPITGITSLTASTKNSIVYYDHWEDGYEVNLSNPTQSTTEIWGDNDPSNGIASRFHSRSAQCRSGCHPRKRCTRTSRFQRYFV